MRSKLVSTILCVSLLCMSFGSFAYAGDNTKNSHRSISKTRKYKKVKKYRKYRQWRAARARMLRQRAARQRRLRAKRVVPRARRIAKIRAVNEADLPSFPFAGEMPAGWKRVAASANQVTYSVDEGRGTAVISIAGVARGETIDTGRKRSIGGVSTTTLRRQVIDQMVREQGWIVNDYQKTIAGRSVFVVVAQSEGRNAVIRSRTYYFTEADGRIYSVATSVPLDAADRMSEQSALVIGSMAPGSRASIRE